MRYLFFLVFIGAFFSFSCKPQDILEPHPEQYELNQNWPNPFRDTTYITYGVPVVNNDTGPTVQLAVYDRFDKMVVILAHRSNHPAMIDTVMWNGRNSEYEIVPPGIYSIELQTVYISTTVHDRILVLKLK